ncbi:MAG: cytochrome c oxidase assembly protein [Actinomycetota bacterium]|nr:cytochrome c oxidase assembly protein [Actinomycetota bacterium]MDQ2959393.1 cytochrome c oxidase assembly protein [Actinomycetota bacterium]
MALAQTLTATSIAGSAVFQPLAVLVAVLALAGYLRQVGRVNRLDPARPWPWLRTASFVLGVLVLLVVSCGPPGFFARTVYWVWVSQSLTLLLIVPVPLMCGQPIELIRATSPANRLVRLLDSSFGQRLSSPLVGPALIPLVCVATLFGPVPGWAAGTPAINWLIQLLLVLLGAAIVLPLVAAEDLASSVAVGAAVAVGFIELLVDAVPGIVLRLSTHPVSSFFSQRSSNAHAPAWLHDQQIGGGVLWCVAELLDLPFLLLVFRRWVRADAREAAVIDAALDADERSVSAGVEPGSAPAAGEPTDDQPWFLSDPRLRDRLR